jgi:hypothetical protein
MAKPILDVVIGGVALGLAGTAIFRTEHHGIGYIALAASIPFLGSATVGFTWARRCCTMIRRFDADKPVHRELEQPQEDRERRCGILWRQFRISTDPGTRARILDEIHELCPEGR